MPEAPKRLTAAQAEAVCAAWNAKRPAGTIVSLREGDEETLHRTKTRAWVAASHVPVIQLVGKPAVYLLSRVTPSRRRKLPGEA